MENLTIWNQVKQPPSNFLKRIEFGYLKGKSDINPQWRLMAMTQAFGPVGHGWTYRITQKWTETAPCGTVMAFAEVAVKTKLDGEWGEEFYGIGGSQIVEIAKDKLKANDEGFKMAVTDALGVAFKAVGMAADVYFGNYDGSKYAKTTDEAYEDPSKKLQQSYEKALPFIDNCTDTALLDKTIAKFKNTEYAELINNACERRKAEITG